MVACVCVSQVIQINQSLFGRLVLDYGPKEVLYTKKSHVAGNGGVSGQHQRGCTYIQCLECPQKMLDIIDLK